MARRPEDAAPRAAPKGDGAPQEPSGDEDGARARRRARPRPDGNGAPSAPSPQVEELRAILRDMLLEPERARLERLEGRPVQLAAEHLAAVLPDAVRQRVLEDDQLAAALASTIESGLERSARQNPTVLAEAIHPALGPAIRKAIQAALAQSLEGFNAALENSLSPRGLAWRFEALRSGRSFAEVALLKTLVFRVEQVFLIHRKSGVLLVDAAHPTVARKDPELVSSMLAAIQDFAIDSFGADPETTLDRIDLAGLRITLVGRPDAVLAAVVRGNPPEHLSEDLEEALEELGEKCGAALHSFRGETTPFEAQRHVLEACLTGEERPPRRSPIIRLIAPALAIGLLVWAGISFFRANAESRYRAAVAQTLEETPGLLLLATHERDGVLHVRGLRDRAAPDPEAIVRAVDPARGLTGVALEFAPYEAPGQAFVEARLEARLDPPAGVSIEVANDGRAVLRGHASSAFVRRARLIAPTVQGVTALDVSELIDADLAHLRALALEAEGLAVRFSRGLAVLPPDDLLAPGVAASVADLARAAERAGRLVRVELIPLRHDAEPDTADLALRRLQTVRALLAPSGHDALLFELAPVTDGSIASAVSGQVRLRPTVLAMTAPEEQFGAAQASDSVESPR